MSTSRNSILEGIRRSSGVGRPGTPSESERQQTVQARLNDTPVGIVPQRAEDDEGCLARFKEMVLASAASLAEVPNWAAVPEAVVSFLKERNLPMVLTTSLDPRLAPLQDHGLLTVRRGVALPQDLIGVVTAVGGVAETGSLVLTSGPEAPTSLNFLPDIHIICVQAADVAGGFETVWARLRAQDSMPRTVNLITGPSRTGDIEQTILMGAHGPRQVHVIVVNDGA